LHARKKQLEIMISMTFVSDS